MIKLVKGTGYREYKWEIDSPLFPNGELDIVGNVSVYATHESWDTYKRSSPVGLTLQINGVGYTHIYRRVQLENGVIDEKALQAKIDDLEHLFIEVQKRKSIQQQIKGLAREILNSL